MFNYHFEHQELELPPLLSSWLARTSSIWRSNSARFTLERRHYAFRWRAKRLRPGEIDAIDDRTHPAHEILVTTRG
jgi:hypothetical protein